MNTEELESYMKCDPCISKLMGGVVPKDLLPPPEEGVKLFIVNLDTSNKQGSHWIVLLLSKECICEYFDPLGNNIDNYIAEYLNTHSLPVLVNTKQCQNHNTLSCGKFCLFYCFFRSRCKTMQEILNYFKHDTVYNDILVNCFYEVTT